MIVLVIRGQRARPFLNALRRWIAGHTTLVASGLLFLIAAIQLAKAFSALVKTCRAAELFADRDSNCSPLALGIAVSPVPIIAAIPYAALPEAKRTSIAFLGGWLLGIVVAVTIFTLISALDSSGRTRCDKAGLSNDQASSSASRCCSLRSDSGEADLLPESTRNCRNGCRQLTR